MKFNSRRVVTIWDLEVITTWRETFLNVKRNSTQLKGIVSHDEAELNANKLGLSCAKLRARFSSI